MAKGKFVLGAVIGAAAGVVAGILSAPKSGKETRADLKRRANELKAEADQKVKQTASGAGRKGAEIKDQAEDLKERVEAAVQGAKEGFSKKPLGPKGK